MYLFIETQRKVKGETEEEERANEKNENAYCERCSVGILRTLNNSKLQTCHIKEKYLSGHRKTQLIIILVTKANDLNSFPEDPLDHDFTFLSLQFHIHTVTYYLRLMHT